ncbi:MAG: IS30 family transposase [Solirubrobacteraceae bacterium]
MPRGGPDGWLSPAEREQVVVLLGEGVRVMDVAARFGCEATTIYRIRRAAHLQRRRVLHSRHRLSWEERERISRGLAAGESARAIARDLGRAASTIAREVAGCGGRDRYRALRAERLAGLRARRPKPTKLSRCPRLLAAVQAGLEQRWSPEQISARLKAEHPDDPEMRISHETIYQSLYVQARGEFRRQLSSQLRTGRTRRRPSGTVQRRGQIMDMVAISERPAEVADRAVPGHWEGDLIAGKGGRSYVATLVERHTRYVLLARLGNTRTTEHVIAALAERIQDLPVHLKLSLTWDQGKELSAHRRFSVATGVSVYFCDPHSPWQRGSNENTNGLLRQYLPKNSDLALHSQTELDLIAAELNGRPRQTLGWMKPAEKMLELLASTPQ